MNDNKDLLAPHGEDDEQNFFTEDSKLINPVRAGLNVDLTVNQRFMGKGMPVTSFGNPVIDDLECDVVWMLYLWKYNLRTPPEGREANRALLDWLMADPFFQQMRGTYINHGISAAAAGYEITKRLIDDMQGVGNGLQGMGEAEQMEDEADDLEQQADSEENGEDEQQQSSSGDEEGDEDGEGDGGGYDEDDWDDGGSDPEEDDWGDGDDGDWNDNLDDDKDNEPKQDNRTPEQKRQDAQDLRNQAEKKRQQAEKQLEQALGSNFSSMLRANALNQGNEFGQEVQDFLSSWGFEEGQGIDLDVEEIRRLMSMLGERNIAQLTATIGRVKDVALQVLRGRSQMQVVIDSTGYTLDVSDMFLDQQALLTDVLGEDVRQHFISEMMRNGGMLGYTRVNEARSEGSFISGVDESGSMSSYVGGEQPTSRSIVAKALSLGLARAAKMNGQEFYMFGFAESSYSVTDLISDRSLPSEMLKFATHNTGGGTDFNVALNTCMDIFDAQEEKDKLSSDLLMITDGEAEVGDDVFLRVMDAKEQYGVRLHLLLIGGSSMESIEGLADTIIQFDSLDNVAEKLAQAFWLQ